MSPLVQRLLAERGISDSESFLHPAYERHDPFLLPDMEVESFLLVSTLRVILGQRLVRKLASDREEYRLSEHEIKELERVADLDRVVAALKEEGHVPKKATIKSISFYRPKEGGESPDGYTSRVGIHEVLPITHAIRVLIAEGAPAEEVEKQAKIEGMLTMVEDGIFKAARGITTAEEVLRVISE